MIYFMDISMNLLQIGFIRGNKIQAIGRTNSKYKLIYLLNSVKQYLTKQNLLKSGVTAYRRRQHLHFRSGNLVTETESYQATNTKHASLANLLLVTSTVNQMSYSSINFFVIHIILF